MDTFRDVTVSLPASILDLKDKLVKLITDIKNKTGITQEAQDAIALAVEGFQDFAIIEQTVSGNPAALAMVGTILISDLLGALRPVVPQNPPVPDPAQPPPTLTPAADASLQVK